MQVVMLGIPAEAEMLLHPLPFSLPSLEVCYVHGGGFVLAWHEKRNLGRGRVES